MILILLSTNIALILFQSNISVKEKLIKSINEEKKKREMYIDVMEELMDNIKSFKHDYGNSLRTLGGYIEVNDNEGAMNFLKSLSYVNDDEKVLQYYELKYLKEPGLKGLIISKVSDMIKKDLDFTISIDQSNQLSDHSVDMLDLSRVIGIILDNAIEASELSESKKVFINILENKCSTEIVVSNSFSGSFNVSSLSERGYSTKGNSRGIGLYNAEQILYKYKKINMFTSINNNMFFQKVELTR
jgi:two-component system sensor histidine kinase AgrC